MISRHCDERQSTAGKALFYVTVEAEFDLVSAEDGTRTPSELSRSDGLGRQSQ